uniref:Uncharacterized protein n=1 Tax=Candidatus Kentrum sp. SD TaxID=2126332 RepID=A0A451BN02_9GAMM|nr:MAG: hypothetical protein BECKSD772D_GA0070982_105618 [Candidatus Kentron sp. SD]
MQAKQREAKTGIERYQTRLVDKFGDSLRLHSFSVVAIGFERLVFQEFASQ